MSSVQIRFDRFPDGRSKSVVFSFDDGRDHDRKLVAMMNQYELRGTFHLNSGNLGKAEYIHEDEAATLFAGHEISGHTVNHPFLEQSPGDQIAEEILSDRSSLEAIAGYPVRGISYPFGTYDDKVAAMLPALGIEYARTVQSHGRFDMPGDPLRWHPTCHHKEMVDYAERFLESNPRHNRMELLFIWGHSYEFNNDNNWELVDRAGTLLGGKRIIWHATMSEIVLYRKALDALRFSVDRTIVHNPSALDLWFSVNGEAVKAGAGETIRL